LQCFGYYAKFESVDNLLKQLGHGSTEMLRKSYNRAVSKEETFLVDLPSEVRNEADRFSSCFGVVFAEKVNEAIL
jgi:hypothetical protein